MDWMYMIVKKPAYQALLFCLLTPIIILVLQPKNPDKTWTISALVFFVFTVINAGLLWLNDNSWRYFFISIGVAVGYMLLAVLITQGMINILKLKGSGETSMAFLVIIYHPPLLLLVMFAKWVVTKLF